MFYLKCLMFKSPSERKLYLIVALLLFRIDLTTCSGSTSLTREAKSSLDFLLPSILSYWRLGSNWLCCRSCTAFTTMSSIQLMATMISSGLTSASRRLIMSCSTFRRGLTIYLFVFLFKQLLNSFNCRCSNMILKYVNEEGDVFRKEAELETNKTDYVRK